MSNSLLQEKLIHVIIALCAGTVFCVLVLIVITVSVTWNRKSKGIYKVKPNTEPVR